MAANTRALPIMDMRINGTLSRQFMMTIVSVFELRPKFSVCDLFCSMQLSFTIVKCFLSKGSERFGPKLVQLSQLLLIYKWNDVCRIYNNNSRTMMFVPNFHFQVINLSVILSDVLDFLAEGFCSCLFINQQCNQFCMKAIFILLSCYDDRKHSLPELKFHWRLGQNSESSLETLKSY